MKLAVLGFERYWISNWKVARAELFVKGKNVENLPRFCFEFIKFRISAAGPMTNCYCIQIAFLGIFVTFRLLNFISTFRLVLVTANLLANGDKFKAANKCFRKLHSFQLLTLSGYLPCIRTVALRVQSTAFKLAFSRMIHKN